MKHTRRFLVAMAMLLAALLISGLALAADEATETELKSIKIELLGEATRDLEMGLLDLYENVDYKITMDPEDPDDVKNLRLVVSDDKIAKVLPGVPNVDFFWGIGVGTVEVRVQALDRYGRVLKTSDAVKLTFKEVPVQEIVYNTTYDATLLNLSVKHSPSVFWFGDCISILPINATYCDKYDMDWKVKDGADIIRVDNAGNLVEVVKPGEATVVATSKGASPKTVEIKVRVVANPVTELTFSPDTFTMTVGDELDLAMYVDTNSEADVKNVSWTSSDRDVVTVTQYVEDKTFGGDVYAKDVGEATVTMQVLNYDGTTVSADVKITVEADSQIKSLKFGREEYKIKYGQAYTVNLDEKLIVSPRYVPHDVQANVIRWESSDETVAIVEQDTGMVYFEQPGTVTITATYVKDETVTASVKVTAEKVPIRKVSVNKKTFTYAPGLHTYSEALKVTIEPSYAWVDENSITITSSHPEIADAEFNYLMTGYGIVMVDLSTKEAVAGSSTITVGVSDGEKTYEASCVVNVEKKTPKITLSDRSLTLYLHKDAADNKKQAKLTAKVLNTYTADSEYGNEDAAVTWKSSDRDVVTVDRFGNLTVKGEGKAVITATTKDGTKVSATCNVSVKKELTKKINGNKKMTMRVGEEYRGLISDGFLTFKPSRSILYNDTLRFTSSDKNIVSVNSRGYLAANSVGTAKITVEARDGSGVKFSFKVKVIEAQKAK